MLLRPLHSRHDIAFILDNERWNPVGMISFHGQGIATIAELQTIVAAFSFLRFHRRNSQGKGYTSSSFFYEVINRRL
jgi:hypothetical protein